MECNVGMIWAAKKGVQSDQEYHLNAAEKKGATGKCTCMKVIILYSM